MQHSHQTPCFNGSRSIHSDLTLKLRTAGITLLWCAGLVLAGSESPLMPYLNGLGVVLFAGASLGLVQGMSSQVRVSMDPDQVSGPDPGFRSKDVCAGRLVPASRRLDPGLCSGGYSREANGMRC